MLSVLFGDVALPLLNLVWGVNQEGGPRTVDIPIRRMRVKLPSRASSLLETRCGAGYGFLGQQD
jgi:two-component system alkaline phosphatase synthesis response regulator PhoP